MIPVRFLIRYHIHLMVIFGGITRLEVCGVAVDHFPNNNEGGAPGPSSSYGDPLLVDPEPSKPMGGSVNGLPSGVKAVGIGRRVICDSADFGQSSIDHWQMWSLIRMDLRKQQI